MMNWDDIRIFLAVARKGSLTAAGVDLVMSASSVSRHIEELEHRLGVVLFLRSQTGYMLSDAGLAVIADAEQAESALIDIGRKASGAAETLSGTVRIALPENLATHIILPEISQFLKRYNAIFLEIVTNVSLTNLTRREADISLRLVRPETKNLIVSRAAQMSSALYASVDYLTRYPFDPKQCGKGHFAISWGEGFEHLQACVWLNERFSQASVSVRATTLQSQLSACIGGAGLSVLPCFIADPIPNLVRIMTPKDVYTQNIWLLVHHDINKLSRIRAVTKFILDTLQYNHSRLLGLLKSDEEQ